MEQGEGVDDEKRGGGALARFVSKGRIRRHFYASFPTSDLPLFFNVTRLPACVNFRSQTAPLRSGTFPQYRNSEAPDT